MNLQIKTRQQAAEAGEQKYYTGKNCSRGHNCERYTSTGACCKCNAEGVKKYNARTRTVVNNRSVGAFVYKLHPDDHVAAFAYCQALDIQRGRIPSPALAPILDEPDIVAIRRHAFKGDY